MIIYKEDEDIKEEYYVRKLVPLAGLCYSSKDGEGCVGKGRGVKRKVISWGKKSPPLSTSFFHNC